MYYIVLYSMYSMGVMGICCRANDKLNETQFSHALGDQSSATNHKLDTSLIDTSLCPLTHNINGTDTNQKSLP